MTDISVNQPSAISLMLLLPFEPYFTDLSFAISSQLLAVICSIIREILSNVFNFATHLSHIKKHLVVFSFINLS